MSRDIFIIYIPVAFLSLLNRRDLYEKGGGGRGRVFCGGKGDPFRGRGELFETVEGDRLFRHICVRCVGSRFPTFVPFRSIISTVKAASDVFISQEIFFQK